MELEKGIVSWLKKENEKMKAEGFVPTIDLLLERLEEKVEAIIDAEAHDCGLDEGGEGACDNVFHLAE